MLGAAEGCQDPVLELKRGRVGDDLRGRCWPRELEVRGVSLSCCRLGKARGWCPGDLTTAA